MKPSHAWSPLSSICLNVTQCGKPSLNCFPLWLCEAHVSIISYHQIHMPSPTPHNSPRLPQLPPPPHSLVLPCCPESPVTMVTALEKHHASPHHQAQMQACTCYLYEVMETIFHWAECSYEDSVCSSLCPVKITWPHSPPDSNKKYPCMENSFSRRKLLNTHPQIVLK